MVPADTLDRTIDPVENINAVLEKVWAAICAGYEVSGCLPEMQDLFKYADLSRPEQAAQAVLVSMLQEVNENISRFSPWYKQPARAFGLVSVYEARSNRARWMLAPEAIQKWQAILEALCQVIRKYSGLIQALVLVGDLMEDLPNDPCVVAQCGCNTPLTIRLPMSVLERAVIVCERCSQPFH